MTLAAPFPYFGGKRRAAPAIWAALGDPGAYIEPFCGSAAVLLARPSVTGRRVETINDADGWLINAWRAIQLSPGEVARHAAGPVSEVDYHARLAWLQERRTPELIPWLEGDPEHHDAKAAAWWLYVEACGIGDPWGGGPWRVIDGRLQNSRTAPSRERGEEVSPGVNRKLPHLGNAGQGIHRALPHLGNAGRGIHRALPHLGDAGQGEHAAQLTHYMERLATRLERVRITAGDWRRVLQPSVTRATSGGDGSTAVLLDPPYEVSGDIYAHTESGISADVRQWSTKADPNLRIVLCGYDTEHDALLEHGWVKREGKSGGGAGYSNNPLNGHRERLWLSPSCLGVDHHQGVLDFGGLA